MALLAEPGAPLPPKRPLLFRILGHSILTSTAMSSADRHHVIDASKVMSDHNNSLESARCLAHMCSLPAVLQLMKVFFHAK